MAKRDFTNRVSIDRALIPALSSAGRELLYDDLCGIVNYALRQWLTASTAATPAQPQTSPASPIDSLLDLDIDLSA